MSATVSQKKPPLIPTIKKKHTPIKSRPDVTSALVESLEITTIAKTPLLKNPTSSSSKIQPNPVLVSESDQVIASVHKNVLTGLVEKRTTESVTLKSPRNLRTIDGSIGSQTAKQKNLAGDDKKNIQVQNPEKKKLIIPNQSGTPKTLPLKVPNTQISAKQIDANLKQSNKATAIQKDGKSSIIQSKKRKKLCEPVGESAILECSSILGDTQTKMLANTVSKPSQTSSTAKINRSITNQNLPKTTKQISSFQKNETQHLEQATKKSGTKICDTSANKIVQNKDQVALKSKPLTKKSLPVSQEVIEKSLPNIATVNISPDTSSGKVGIKRALGPNTLKRTPLPKVPKLEGPSTVHPGSFKPVKKEPQSECFTIDAAAVPVKKEIVPPVQPVIGKITETKNEAVKTIGVKRNQNSPDSSLKPAQKQAKKTKSSGLHQSSLEIIPKDDITISPKEPSKIISSPKSPATRTKPNPEKVELPLATKIISKVQSPGEQPRKSFDIRQLSNVPPIKKETPTEIPAPESQQPTNSAKVQSENSKDHPTTPLPNGIETPPSVASEIKTESSQDSSGDGTIIKIATKPEPKKRGRPRLHPDKKGQNSKKNAQETSKRSKPKNDPLQQIGNANNVVAFIGSKPVVNIQKELLSGASEEDQDLANLCIRYLETLQAREQTAIITKKVLRVLGAIRRKSNGKDKSHLGTASKATADCIAYVGDVPKSLQEQGVQPVTIEEVKSWYKPGATEKELTTTVNYHEGTYKIAIRPEALSHIISENMERVSSEINVKVPLPPGSSVSSMNEFISKVNRINPPNGNTGGLVGTGGLSSDTGQGQTNCPGPQHKNWLPDAANLEEAFKRYAASRVTYYESLYEQSQDDHCDTHISQQISRSHVNAMLRMPIEQFFKLCSNGTRCETYKLGLHNRVEPFVGMAYLSPLELAHAMEMRCSPIEEGLCYLCILSCYTSQYAQNSAAGSSTRIKVPFEHIHSIPGEYIPQAMITQTTGMTNGLLTQMRTFSLNDYIPITTDVVTSLGSISSNVPAFEEKGHLVFRYSSRNPQPLSTDPQESYTVSCAPALTTCYLLRETLSSGVTSRRQIVDITELYVKLGFIKKVYSNLIIGPSSANPSGISCLIDRIFIAPPKPTRRRSVTIKTKTGPDRRNTQLSSSSVSHILLASAPRGSSSPEGKNIAQNNDSKHNSSDDMCYSTFGGRPFDMVFSDSVSTTMEYIDSLCSLFGYKQSGVDGTVIIRYPFISLYDDKDIEFKRASAFKNSLKSVHQVGGSNANNSTQLEDDEDENFDEGQEMFFFEDYKFYHSIMLRVNVAFSIGESISRPGGLTFSQLLEVLDNLSDPHRDTQTNKESQESKELKERIKLYEKLPRKYLLKKLVSFINGHKNALDFFHKNSAISDDELMTIPDKWVYIPSKIKEWRTLMILLEPKIPYKYDKLDENHFTPDISHHKKPSPRECISKYLNQTNPHQTDNLCLFEAFENTRNAISLLDSDTLVLELSKCKGFPHWNPQHLSSRIFDSNGSSFRVCSDNLQQSTIYLALLLRIHYSYELLGSLQTKADGIVSEIMDFVTSSRMDPREDYENYSLSDEHFSLIDPYERIPGYEDNSSECNLCESDFFKVFYMNELDKYGSTSQYVNDGILDSSGTVKQQSSNGSNLGNVTENTEETTTHSHGEEVNSSETCEKKTSNSDDQLESWIVFSRSLLSKSARGRHHVYLLRRKLLELREIIYQIRAFICTHIQLATYLFTSGFVTDNEIIADEIVAEGGTVSKFVVHYPGDHRFYGEGSQPDCVTSHMYVNFFARQGTENRSWYYLLGKLLPRCCQSRKWCSKHESACKTNEAYRLWVCMCLRISITGMYRSRRQWLKFENLLKADSTCKSFFDDKELFQLFQTKYPGLVMNSLRESMIWQIGLNPPLLRIYLEYFQQWRSFSLTVKQKMESVASILDASGKVCDSSGIIDELFSGSRFVFRRVCFDFVPFILGIFKEINGVFSEESLSGLSGQTSRRKSTPKTPRKSTRKNTTNSISSNTNDHNPGENDESTKKNLYYSMNDSVGTAQSRPEPLDSATISLIDMFVEFMNPHDDIDLRSLSMIGLSSEGIDNLRFIYSLFIAGEQNRSSATMLKQMSPRDYELSFYFFTAFRRHSSIIAIPCDYDVRAKKLSGIRWKYAINEKLELPDASTSIVFSQCCCSMKSLPQSGEGPRYYGHARIVYSENGGYHVCWAKREKGMRKRTQKQSSSTPPAPKYSKTMQKNSPPNTKNQDNKKDRYEKLCGETPVIAIPGTFVIQHDPIKEKPNPVSYTICPGQRCGGVTPFSLAMWGPNGFTCTICDETDRENAKAPRCDICQIVKKRSQSWVQPFMYDNIPGTGKIERYLICPICARKCGMDDRLDFNRNQSFVHDMTFFECQAMVERVVKVEDREQQFCWGSWRARRINKHLKKQQTQQQQQQQTKKRVKKTSAPKLLGSEEKPSKAILKKSNHARSKAKQANVNSDTEDCETNPNLVFDKIENDTESNAEDCCFEDMLFDDEDDDDDGDKSDDSDMKTAMNDKRFEPKKLPKIARTSTKAITKKQNPPSSSSRFSTRIGRMPRKRRR